MPKNFIGMRIAPHEYEHYEQGEVICAYKCEPNEIVGKHYWIWYDFQSGKLQCSTSRPGNDRYIPEAFTRQQNARTASVNQALSGGIRMGHSTFGSAPSEDDGICMVHGTPSDDFKHFMEMHPGMSFEEAKHKFKEMLKQRSRVSI